VQSQAADRENIATDRRGVRAREEGETLPRTTVTTRTSDWRDCTVYVGNGIRTRRQAQREDYQEDGETIEGHQVKTTRKKTKLMQKSKRGVGDSPKRKTESVSVLDADERGMLEKGRNPRKRVCQRKLKVVERALKFWSDFK